MKNRLTNRPLRENELAYILFHLDLTMDTVVLRDLLRYTPATDGLKEKIVFIPHTGDLSVKTIDNLPILFASNGSDFYSIDEKGNLIFYHDILKSAFYLLSGYDEHFANTQRDHWGRVKFEESIQKKLDIISRPIVNEYFQLILEGVNIYLTHHQKPPLKKRKLFPSFGFLLSHDIDVIDKYGWPHLGFKIKESLGMAKSDHSKLTLFQATLQSFFQFINPKRANPYWNFDYLMQVEKEFDINASYYFLSKDKSGGSRYLFNEPRLKLLFNQLKENGHEIGIHGTTKTANNLEALGKERACLEAATKTNIIGGRQHRLWLNLEKSFDVHSNAGLKYDTTFGYAEHEGFRNSFCLPFKPYDFKNEKAVDLWQFPLMAMDVTLYSYRMMEGASVKSSIKSLVGEVKKHFGIFTLLWHNSFFDETLYPGVTNTYEEILELITNENPSALTGKSLVDLLNEEER